jgi:hypothetical protein
MKYKLGDNLTFIYFGSPANVEITEERKGAVFCRNEGAYGGSWYTENQIDDLLKKYDQWQEEKRNEENRYWQNGGPNGPTGHGEDICYSDADSGL